MDDKLTLYFELNSLFKSHGFKLFLVGGTVRNYLLKLPLTDMDLVTDATPKEMETFIDGSYKYSHLGNVSMKYKGVHFDITTLRKEKIYDDFRHPLEVIFVKDLKEDVVRRDFTINALYMDEFLTIYDFVDGTKDLKNRILRVVGDPKKRIQEDPLRIVRAARFSITYNLTISVELKQAILQSTNLLDRLNSEKIKMDLKKMKNYDLDKVKKTFDELGIHHLLNML